MINSLLVLFLCQFLGEAIVHFTGMTIPGPVAGMILLLAGLIIKGNLPGTLDKTAMEFVRHIGLLFVPAGAGISLYLNLIAEQWVIILIASLTSTAITLILTAFIFKTLEKKE